jgi:prepilin-type processing-associated H-X9-DG protein
VFVDEHPDSINDGWLMTNVTDPNQWEDLPASYHNGACGFSFADGHAEIHRWLEATTKLRVRQVLQNGGYMAPKSRDVAWMIQHASARSR